MANNEFKIDLTAGLDEQASKAQINSDINKLEGSIDKIKITATLDSSKVDTSNLGQQISQQISNVSNSSNVTSASQNVGEQIGKNITTGISNAVKDGNIAKEFNDINKTISQALGNIDSSRLTDIIKELKGSSSLGSTTQEIQKVTNEFITLGESVIKGETSWDAFINKMMEVDSYLKNNTVTLKSASEITSEYADDLRQVVYKLKDTNINPNSDFARSFLEAANNIGIAGDKEIKTFNDLRKHLIFLNVSFKEFEQTTARFDGIFDGTAFEDKFKDETIENQIEKWCEALLKFRQVRDDTVVSGKDQLVSTEISDSLVEYYSNIEKAYNEIGGLVERQKELNTAINEINTQNIDKYSSIASNNSMEFVGADAARQAKVYFDELLSSEEAVVSVSERLSGEDNSLNGFTIQIKRASGEVEKLNYRLKETDDTMDNTFVQDNANVSLSEIEKRANQLNKIKASLEQFKSTNNTILSGLTSEINDVNNAILRFESGVGSITSVQNAMERLKSSASGIKSELTGEWDRTSKAVRELENAENTIQKLSTSMSQLGNIPNELPLELENIKNKLNEINNIESQEGRSKNWTRSYAEYERAVTSLTNKIKELHRAENADKSELNAAKQKKALQDIEAYLAKNTKLTQSFSAEAQELVNQFTKLKSEISRLDISSGGFGKDFSKLTTEVATAKKEVKALGYEGDSFITSFGRGIKSLTNYFSGFYLAMRGISTIKDMVSEVTAIDTAMINLQKVTDETDSTYNKFLQNACDNAQNLGREVSSLVEQTAEWSKLGYSMTDAEQLAQNSSIYANVGEIDDSTAVSDMVTAMKAFNIEASDSMKIVDGLNTLGNKFATSAGALGTGLSNSASSMAAANNSLEQTLAMLTGMSEIMQNSSEAGNALKILSMRIRGYDEDTQGYTNDVEELTGKVADLTKTAKTPGGISLFTDQTKQTFKETYQIMYEISQIWDDLTDKDQAKLTEVLAGKTRGNAISALIQSFNSGQVQKAMDELSNSTGSAMAEQERWLDSIEAKTKQFEAAYQSLANTVISSDFIKNIVDGGTSAVNMLEKLISFTSPLTVLTTTLGGIFSVKGISFKNMFGKGSDLATGLSGKFINASDVECLTNLNNEMKNGASFAEAYVNNMAKCSSGAKQFAINANNAKISTEQFDNEISSISKRANLLTNTFNALKGALAGMAVGFVINGIVQLGSAIADADENIQELAKSAGEAFNEKANNIDSYKTEINDLAKTISDSDSSLEDAIDARKRLMEIQDEIIAKYGSENTAVQSISNALKGEADAFDDTSEQLKQKIWEDTKNDLTDRENEGWWGMPSVSQLGSMFSNWLHNADNDLDRVIKDYEKTRMGQVFLDTDKLKEDGKNIDEVLQKIKDMGVELLNIKDTGILALKFDNKNAEINKDAVNEVQKYLESIGQGSITSNLSDISTYYKDIIESDKEIYDQQVLYERIMDKNGVKNGYKSYYDELLQMQKDYEKALTENPDFDNNMESLWNMYTKLNEAKYEALQNGDKDVANYYDLMFKELQTKFDTMKFKANIDVGALKIPTEALNKPLSEVKEGIKKALESGDYGVYDNLINKAKEYGLITNGSSTEINNLLNLLTQWGYFQDDITNKVDDTKTAYENISLGNLDFSNSANAIKSAELMDKALASLDKSYNTLLNDNQKIDLSNLSEMADVFGNLNGFDDFINTVKDATSVTGEVQGAFDSLLTEYVNTKLGLENLDESQKKLMNDMLESVGICEKTITITDDIRNQLDSLIEANVSAKGSMDELTDADIQKIASSMDLCTQEEAEILVRQRLQTEKEAEILLSKDFQDVTYDEINALLENANVSETTRQAIANYAQEKANANGVTLTTDGCINNLNSLVGALNNTIGALNNYYSAVSGLENTYNKFVEVTKKTAADATANAMATGDAGMLKSAITLQKAASWGGVDTSILKQASKLAQTKTTKKYGTTSTYSGSGTSKNSGKTSYYTYSGGSNTTKGTNSKNNKKSGSGSGSGNKKKGTGSGNNKKTKEKTEKDAEQFDWIERALDRLSKAAEKAKDKIESIFDLKYKQSKTNDAIYKLKSEINGYNKAYDAYIKKANSVGLSSAWKKKVQNGSYSISEVKDENLAKKIKEYEKWYDKAKEAKEKVEELKESEKELFKQRLENIKDYYNAYSDKNNANIDKIQAKIDAREKQGWSLTSDNYKSELNAIKIYQNIEKNNLEAEKKKYKAQLEHDYSNKTIDYSTYFEGLVYVSELEAKITSINADIKETERTIKAIKLTKLENAKARYDEKASLYQAKIEKEKSVLGKSVNLSNLKSYYNTLLSNQNSSLDNLRKQRHELANQTLQLSKDSTLYNENMQKIAEIDSEIEELGQTINETKSAMTDDIWWTPIEKAIEKIDQYQNKLTTLADLISDDSLLDKNGNVTDQGYVKIALITKDIESSKKEVAQYLNDIAQLTNKKSQYTEEDYQSKMETLENGLLQAASDIKSANDSLLSIFEEKTQKEIDKLNEVIELRKEALNRKKEYYDYDKTIKDKTKDIASLQAQIAALSGATSAESQAEKAKLEEQLKESQEDLNETVLDHRVSIISDGLDEFANNLQESYDEQIELLKTNLEEQASVIQDITTTYGEFGYQTANSLNDMFKNLTGSDLISKTTTNAGGKIAEVATTDDLINPSKYMLSAVSSELASSGIARMANNVAKTKTNQIVINALSNLNVDKMNSASEKELKEMATKLTNEITTKLSEQLRLLGYK